MENEYICNAKLSLINDINGLLEVVDTDNSAIKNITDSDLFKLSYDEIYAIHTDLIMISLHSNRVKSMFETL